MIGGCFSIFFAGTFCSDVTSGFYIGEFLRRDFPLDKDESYYIIASPPWYKDDALQGMLNAIVGKRSIAVIPLKEPDMNCFKENAKKTAGVYFKHNKNKKTVATIVLSCDWDRIRKDASI